jgi:hypothetical protein
MSLPASVSRALASFRGAFFLGLDVSVASTGIVLLDARGALAHASSSRVPRGSSVLAAGAALSAALARATRARPVRATTVEDFLQTFAAGASSSATRFALARVNGVAMYEAWRHTRAPVVPAFATSMRAYFGLERAAPAAAAAAAAAAAGAVFRGAAGGDAADAAAEKRARGRARASSRAAGKAAVVAFALATHPTLFDGGGEGGVAVSGASGDDATDKADAALAAMFALAQEVEWHVLCDAGGAAFWEHVDAALPRARVGRGGALGADAIPAVRHALEALHSVALANIAARRAVPAAELSDELSDGASNLGDDDDEGPAGPALPARRRRSSKRTTTAAIAGVPLAVSASAVEKLYARLRAAFSAKIQTFLMGPDGELHWRRPS